MSGSRTFRDVRRAHLLAFCAALCPVVAFALDPNRNLNQYTSTRWGSRDSFPGGAVNAIAQTRDGYLWIGAAHGLVRFDGTGFRLLDHTNTPSLPPGQVLDLLVDPEGVLWVRMHSPYLLRYRGGAFEQMYPEKLPPPFSAARERGATALTRGTSGHVLIATPGAPMRYIAGKFTSAVPSGSLSGIPMSVAQTNDGAVWVGTRDNGLLCARNGSIAQVGRRDQKVNVLLTGPGSELWIGMDSGLLHWDGNALSRRGVPTTLAGTPILALARDRDSNLWISTPAGVTRMASDGSIDVTRGSSFLGVRAIFEDREGNLWIGGSEGLLQLRDAPFLTYTGVAREGGALYIDMSMRTWIAPSSGGLLWIRGAEYRSITQGLDRDVIYSICGSGNELWVGRKLGGVTHLREEAGSLQTRTYTAHDGLAPGVVYAVHRSRDGSVWAGTLSGAVSRIEKSRITTFNAANGLIADAISTIQETPDGAIWVGTAGGLESFRNGNWRKYGGQDGLPPGRVNSLAVDRDGVLWIGSSAGLFFFSGSLVESARNAPASLEGEIFGLAADESGGLWAATDRHVVRGSRASLLGKGDAPATMREFSMADGLPSTRGIRRDRAVAKDPSGRIWFSLQGGLGVINPALPSAAAPALVTLESIAVDGRPLVAAPIARYPSDRRRVVFNFIGVSLAVPGRVRYRYRLDGYDTAWSQPTESREAAYTSLPPARYTFHVMASNSEGLWNGLPASVGLEVEPHLSETLWFRITSLSFAVAALFVGFRYRLARAHEEVNMRFQERLAERTRIARELHDTLLQNFQGLLFELQAARNLFSRRPEDAMRTLDEAIGGAEAAIAEGRDAIHDLRSGSVRHAGLTQLLASAGQELAAAEDSNLNGALFRLTVEGPSRTLSPVLQDELYSIGREILRNAFRHARAVNIEVEIRYDARSLRLRIRDDGVGINPQVLSEGAREGHWGLPGVRERAKLIGAKLDFWSEAGAGTEVQIIVPASVAYSKSPDARRSAWSRKSRRSHAE